ncbi:hypothetical protein LXL04_000617 [Taraxacum kok-saghyz]
MRETEWREVRRKNHPKATPQATIPHRDEPNVTSFYVSNLPGGARKGDLWGACAKFGNLVDMYIAGRRDASGSFFGFIRYRGETDVASIEERLNGIVCRGRKLVANCARHPRKHSPPKTKPSVAQVRHSFRPQAAATDSRSFADVIGCRAPTHEAQPPLKISAIPEVVNWAANGMLIGVAKSFDMLCNFPSLLSLEGFDVCEVKYIGGMMVAVKFKSGRSAEIFKANKNIWLKWFSSLETSNKALVRFERVAWVKVVGLPIQAWDDSNFAAVVENMGKVLVPPSSFWNSENISAGKLCILTACRRKINEELVADLDGEIHKVGIMEVDDDWYPFKPFMVNGSSDSDSSGEDEEEGVPDTWNQQDMEFEEGEIRQDMEEPCPTGVAGDNAAGAGNIEIPFGAHGEYQHASPRISSTARVSIPNENGVNAEISIPKETGFNTEHACSFESGRVDGAVAPNGDPGFKRCIGPIGVDPSSSPTSGKGGNSSPEFEWGDSAVKRRRTKKKNRDPKSSAAGRPSPSIDLNRNLSDGKSKADDRRASPVHSVSHPQT